MTTTVINIRDAPTGWQQDERYVYIGPPVMRTLADRIEGSVFANPFADGHDGTESRCVLEYQRRIQTVCPDLFLQARTELQGKILVYWGDKGGSNHGNVLAAIANGTLKFVGGHVQEQFGWQAGCPVKRFEKDIYRA